MELGTSQGARMGYLERLASLGLVPFHSRGLPSARRVHVARFETSLLHVMPRSVHVNHRSVLIFTHISQVPTYLRYCTVSYLGI